MIPPKHKKGIKLNHPTQDTVTALEAIILYTKIHKKQSQNMTVQVQARNANTNINIDQAYTTVKIPKIFTKFLMGNIYRKCAPK